MHVEELSDAVVMPLRKKTAGVFVDGRCVESSLLIRSWGREYEPAIPQPPAAAIGGTALFAGYLTPHYGHFLLDSLAHLWAAKSHPATPILWCGGRGRLPWQLEILDMLGVANPVVLVQQPTRVERLLLPEPGFVIETVFEPWHAEFLGVVEPGEIVEGRRCWISRAAIPLGTGDRLEGERELEARLQADGWLIYQPERDPVREQLRFLSSCEIIAGIPGSAFHSLVLLRELRSEIRLMDLREPTETFETIAKAKGFRQTLVPIREKSHAYTDDGLLIVTLPHFDEVLAALED